MIRDLRISVTDRCNFRCTYCMPEEGMAWLPRSEVLTFEEIERIARLMVERYGVDSIRLTGGEPTVRAHLPVLVAQLAALRTEHGPVDLAMTTNGATLRLLAGELRRAGLRRINISLDTLDRQRFVEMTRRDELDHVLDGIAAAKRGRLRPGQDQHRRPARRQRRRDRRPGRRSGASAASRCASSSSCRSTRPAGGTTSSVVGQDEIVARIAAVYPLEQMPARGAAPADRWRYLDGTGTVGVIPSVTKPFCGDCDRVRLTADGQFRTCLFATDEFDLRLAMRAGESDDQLAARIERAVGTKWAGHHINQVDFVRPKRSMSQIGG